MTFTTKYLTLPAALVAALFSIAGRLDLAVALVGAIAVTTWCLGRLPR